jgi:hypothetical protein
VSLDRFYRRRCDCCRVVVDVLAATAAESMREARLKGWTRATYRVEYPTPNWQGTTLFVDLCKKCRKLPEPIKL